MYNIIWMYIVLNIVKYVEYEYRCYDVISGNYIFGIILLIGGCIFGEWDEENFVYG